MYNAAASRDAKNASLQVNNRGNLEGELFIKVTCHVNKSQRVCLSLFVTTLFIHVIISLSPSSPLAQLTCRRRHH